VRNRDRSRFRPWGILGGKASEPSNFILNPGTERERILGNQDILVCEPGDVIHIHSPGGGGRGSPLVRPVEEVELDVARGYVSPQGAYEDYGVVIEGGVLDPAATEARRASLRRAEHGGHFHFGPE